jgi:hypothetical protein
VQPLHHLIERAARCLARRQSDAAARMTSE